MVNYEFKPFVYFQKERSDPKDPKSTVIRYHIHITVYLPRGYNIKFDHVAIEQEMRTYNYVVSEDQHATNPTPFYFYHVLEKSHVGPKESKFNVHVGLTQAIITALKSTNTGGNTNPNYDQGDGFPIG